MSPFEELDRDMNEFVSEVLWKRQQENREVPAPRPPIIESELTEFGPSKFSPIEEDEPIVPPVYPSSLEPITGASGDESAVLNVAFTTRWEAY